MNTEKLFDKHSNFWITANAGSGKTTCLVNRFLFLLKSGVKPNEIVCITYTEAGAKEMKDRILNIALKENLNISEKTINISTIHSFCQSFLNANNFIKQDIQILNDDNFQTERIVNIIIGRLDKIDNNNIKQHICNLAKYETIGKFYEVVKNIIENQNFFMLLFDKICNNRKTTSIKDILDNVALDKIKLLLPKDLQKFVGYGDKLKETKKTLQNQLSNTNINVLTTALQEVKIKFDNDINLHNLYEWKNIVLTTQKTPRKKIKDCKNVLIRQIQDYFVEKLRQNGIDATYSILHFAYFVLKEYQNIKYEMNVVNYDDLLFQTYHILNTFQNELKHIYNIKHIMLDEAQDTNPISWDIIRIIIEKTKCYFFVVGDKKQSIYRFQGARVEEYENNEKKFQDLSRLNNVEFVNDINLNISYRSTQEILNYVDEYCNQLENKNAFTENTNLEIKHYSGIDKNNKPEGYFLDKESTIIHEDIENGIVKIDTDISICDDNDKSFEWAKRTNDLIEKQNDKKKEVLDIAEIISKYIYLYQEECNKNIINKKDGIAVIYSKSTTKGNAIFDIISVLKNKYHFNISLKPEIIKKSIYYHDIISIFKFFALQNDDLNLACLLKSDLFGFTDDTLYNLCCCENNNDKTLFEKLKTQFIANETEQNIVNNCKNFLNKIIKSKTLQEILNLIEEITTNNDKYQQAMYFIKQVIAKYGDKYNYDVRGFLRAIEGENFKDIEYKTENTNDDYIYFSTIHGVKGKEFDSVIILDVGDRKKNNGNNNLCFFRDCFWYKTSSCKIQEDDDNAIMLNNDLQKKIEQDEMENKRLEYVSMTRAKRRIVFIKKHT